MSKWTAKLLAVALCAGIVLAGCTQGDSGSTPASQSSETSTAASGEESPAESGSEASETTGGDSDGILNEVGTYPIVKEPITMEMFAMSAPNVSDLQTNDFTKYLEEKTGITWNFQTASNDASTEKINLLLASGDYPDAFMFKTPNIAQFGLKEEIIIPIDHLIPDNMPNYYGDFMSQNPDLYNMQRQADGKIYGVASWNECYHCSHFDKMWVNTMWLEQMEMEVPTTTEEFKAVCQKFLEINPTGVAVTGSTTGWGEQFYDFLVGSFITDAGQRSVDDKLLVSPEGKIVTQTATDEYREALRFMNELYAMGAIYDGSFTQNPDQLRTLMNQPGEPVLFVSYGAIVNGVDAATNPETYSHYRAIAPLEGPDGTRISTNFKYDSLVENKFVLTDKCEYPEAALRWADHFYTVEGYLQYQYGADEGTDWVLNPEGKVGLNGEPALFEVLNPYTAEAQNHDWQDTGLIYAPAFLRLGEATDPNVDIATAEGLEKLLYIETQEKGEPYSQGEGDYDVIPNRMKFTAEEADEIQTIGVELENYIKENRVAFITGTKNPDTDWDAYIAGFEGIGLPKYLEVYQAAWDRSQG